MLSMRHWHIWHRRDNLLISNKAIRIGLALTSGIAGVTPQTTHVFVTEPEVSETLKSLIKAVLHLA